MYPRILNIHDAMGPRSLFLLGPRATGKSTLLGVQAPTAKFYDLLSAEIYGRLLRQPSIIEQETKADDLVIIDEIQKLPQILDEVHRLIFIRNQKFVLTGSSARKLKRGASNLLAGRARMAHLFPLTSREIPDFDLETYLNTGGLPHIHGQPEALVDLRAYVNLYLREEIQAEAVTRSLVGFTHVLDALALLNGEEINATRLGSDVGVQGRTVLNYIEVLEDTLLAFRLPVFQRAKKRKATSRNKFFLFDVGVTNALCKRGRIEIDSELFGRAFEHFVILEVRAYLSYARSDDELSFWRTTSGFEVDLLLGDHTAIEVKATRMANEKHLKGLRALGDEGVFKRRIAVSRDVARRRTDDGIDILPWREFLQALWDGEYRS